MTFHVQLGKEGGGDGNVSMFSCFHLFLDRRCFHVSRSFFLEASREVLIRLMTSRDVSRCVKAYDLRTSRGVLFSGFSCFTFHFSNET